MTTWFESIENGFIIAEVYSVLVFIPVILYSIRVRKGKFNIAKIILDYLFFVYMCIVFALVFLPLPEAGTVLEGRQIQLIPGYALYDIAKEVSVDKVAQVLFNILMTMPFGAYLRYGHKLSYGKVVALSLFLTLFIEIGQYTGLYFIYNGSYRFCDIDDVITNTLGGFLGAVLASKLYFLPKLSKFDIRLETKAFV